MAMNSRHFMVRMIAKSPVGPKTNEAIERPGGCACPAKREGKGGFGRLR
jgi:hypothetical protein